MQRQPDALQPDHQHELQTTARDAGQETAGDTGGEHTYLEEVQPEHGVFDTTLDLDKGNQQDQAQGDGPKYQRIAPAGRRVPIGLNTIGDAKQDSSCASGKGDIARPVKLLIFANSGNFSQIQIGPDCADNADRDADQEDQPPVEVGQDATENQPDHRAENGGNLVDAQSQPALVSGKGIGDDGRAIGKKKARANALHK